MTAPTPIEKETAALNRCFNDHNYYLDEVEKAQDKIENVKKFGVEIKEGFEHLDSDEVTRRTEAYLRDTKNVIPSVKKQLQSRYESALAMMKELEMKEVTGDYTKLVDLLKLVSEHVHIEQVPEESESEI